MHEEVFKRLLKMPDHSFFLFGPRGVGKSTWLKNVLPQAIFIDLLDASQYLELTRNPHILEAFIGNRPDQSWIVIDEIQKNPELLDEVHRLMEARKWKFALCGSSARKLQRSGINLLAGRALTLNMENFSSAEMNDAFNFEFSLEWGLLPLVQSDKKNAANILHAYVNTYLKEEIREEGIIRSMPPFLRFLSIAGLLNGQTMNGQNIATGASVPRSNVDIYFSILIDTLLGHFLPAYQPQLKIRERTHPKFYWFDTGIARAAAGLLHDPVDRMWKGFALETLIFHELRVFNETQQKHWSISYYHTAGGSEIDFVIETQKRQSSSPPHVVCLEVKMTEKWDRKWERSIRDLHANSKICVDQMIGIYTGKRAYHFDGFDVLPIAEFLKRLHTGEIF